MINNLKWINIFCRDICLVLVVAYLNSIADYRSWWLAFLMGAMFVLVSWHFEECRKEYNNKKLK